MGVHLRSLIALMVFSPAIFAADVSGAGASLPAPAYKAWSQNYSKIYKENVGYSATGSGDGIAKVTNRQVAFAGTDTPLSEEYLAKNSLHQFPTLIGAVVVAYNLSQAPQLKLSEKTLAGIFTGQITKWNDQKIKEDNKGMSLPDVAITVVVRSDKSGTTNVFTKYLSEIDKGFAENVGPSMQPAWNTKFMKSPQNEGVSNSIWVTPGAIGYVAYSKSNVQLQYASLQSAKGDYVQPSAAAFAATVTGSSFSSSESSLIRIPAKEAWPMLSMAYIVVDASPQKAKQIEPVIRFFYWAMQNGDQDLRALGYVPLPGALQGRLVSKIASIKPKDGGLINYVVN